VPARRGIFLPPFDELVEARQRSELARRAESRGWDGFFIWDHVAYRPPVEAVADPWVALAAMACATETLRLGPMVTPLSRRRVHKLARETVTLDRLSGGRLILGVGLGSDRNGELEPFGEVVDPRERAQRLDDGLVKLTSYWGGELLPPPLQTPRIPIWVAGRWPNRRPLRRAARWDGLFPIELPDPEALATYVDEIRELRGGEVTGFDFIAEIPAGGEVAPWERAGATWVLTSFPIQTREAEVRDAIESGPG
jgi:alkanesulfonate monooxygenase SsuD/methylene tetrahydromethanopterin reductase-like flavin-dependent oxidoreductase (luciferase family)